MMMMLHSDNTSALQIATNPIPHKHKNHFEVDCDFIEEKVEDKEIRLEYVHTDEQLADSHTKVVPNT